MRLLLTTLLFATVPADENLRLIEDFDRTVQHRLAKPMTGALGMSRVMVRPSFGSHFQPLVTDRRDYAPETRGEREILARLEGKGLQVGLYLFGASILERDGSDLDFRTLKGPGAITQGTPRPKWYPLQALPTPPADGVALPDWREIYPLARRAMQRFAARESGFETTAGGWTIAARPAIALDERCVSCHNHPREGVQRSFAQGDALGGVLYAYRVPSL